MTIPSWSGSRTRRCLGPSAVLALAVVAALVSQPTTAGGHRDAGSVSVVIRLRPGGTGVDAAVRGYGGTVQRHIGVIDGLVAEVPRAALPALAAQPAVASITANAPGHLMGATGKLTTNCFIDMQNSQGSGLYYDPPSCSGSMYSTTVMTGAREMWRAGYTGAGVDVAVIDSGAAPVNGLTAAGKVINGPDLSFESQAANLAGNDTFGHGTNMAGIIAGRDDGVTGPYDKNNSDFIGMAPDARVVSLKVADAEGNTDVSQVLAAIDWVVQHRGDSGMNIRVLNLSFGTDSRQPYVLDPLAFATEVAWRAGIVVVASAGNGGAGASGLTDPAKDPYVIAVGAADTHTTDTLTDDTVATFSSSGDGIRNPDLVAPGVHIESLRVPGSYIDATYAKTGLVTARFFRGSGTSQAAAVVSGAAALIASQRPKASPDQIKALLVGSASPLSGQSAALQGAGELDLRGVPAAKTPSAKQGWPRSNGGGSLEGARGSLHVTVDGVALTGEQDIFGNRVDTTALAAAEAGARAWVGGVWNQDTWTGVGWTVVYSRSSWLGTVWMRSSWLGIDWSSISWLRSSWLDGQWTRSSWLTSAWARSSWLDGGWTVQGWW